MKNTLFLLLTLGFLSLVNAQAPPTSECTFTKNGFVKENPPVNVPSNPPQNPPHTRGNQDGPRIIYWLHGLGGDPTSWGRAMEATAYQSPGQKIPGYPARKAECLAPSYNQFSLNGAGYTLHQQLVTSGDAICSSKGITDKTRNFIIAHSQGGLVSRAADKYYADTGQEGQRRFGGIVTFGTPHLGAKVLNNGDKYAEFASDAFYRLSVGPIADKLFDVVSIPFFGDDVYDKLNNLVPRVSEFVGSTILPVVLEGQQQPITSDYKVGAYPLDELNGYESTLPKIAFFGVEEEPVLWRQMYSFLVKKPNDFPAFQADYDDQLVEKSVILHDWYINKEQVWRQRANNVTSRKKKRAAQETADKYQLGYFWLNGANERYKYLIGALELQTFEVPHLTCVCDIVDYDGNTIYEYEYAADSPADCQSSGPHNGCTAEILPIILYNLIERDNDGIVVAESAQGFSGARIAQMLHSNHQQMRNDSNTKAKLVDVFEGSHGGYFITEEQ
jgi:pimeloyl-ACP methyl ester carboxylesterase